MIEKKESKMERRKKEDGVREVREGSRLTEENNMITDMSRWGKGTDKRRQNKASLLQIRSQ